MQLRTIKLNGFKSFVDPTVITIEGDMTAIVGPNGCGKSNVVDAIRWVIGESSAKQLRGQSMSDVIFNGTSNRKPVSKAAVELIFDHAQGALSGEYAQYSEISIRREVERDGVSRYFINGVVGRRKDILDLFLGTGLGSRSYSIIEQGMISRLIEAKPEDLRAHLEEVAGISKYKERRRETENRMGHTRDNLSRLNDVREEVSKQLRHLKRQANAARRYQEFQAENQQLSAEIMAVEWSQFEEKANTHKREIEVYEAEADQILADQRAAETSITQLREQQVSASEHHNEVQKNFYKLGEVIARLEQNIQHHQQQTSQWQSDYNKLDKTWNELTVSLDEQRAAVEELSQQSEVSQPEILSLESAVAKDLENLKQSELSFQNWSVEWDKSVSLCSTVSKELDVAKNSLSHHENEHSTLKRQVSQLEQQQAELITKQSESDLAPLEVNFESAQAALDELSVGMEQTSQSLTLQRELKLDSEYKVSEARSELQQLEAKHAALESLQQSALGHDDQSAVQWLESNQLTDCRRLGEELQVESGWELALEMVLGHYLEAYCVADVAELLQKSQSFASGHLVLIEQRDHSSCETSSRSLSSKVTCSWALDHWLQGIYTASSHEEAYELQAKLNYNESIITQDGLWLGKHWLRLSPQVSTDDSVIIRQKKIDTIYQDINSLRIDLDQLVNEFNQIQSHLESLESQREQQNQAFKELTDALSQSRTELQTTKSQHAEWQQQRSRVENSIVEYGDRLRMLESSIAEKQDTIATLLVSNTENQQKRLQLENSKLVVEQALVDARKASETSKLNLQQTKSKLTYQENQLRFLRQTLERESRQLEQVTEQRQFLKAQLSQDSSPIVSYKNELQDYLNQRLEVEKTLGQADDQLHVLNNELNRLEQQRVKLDKSHKNTQQILQDSKVAHQSLLVRQSTLVEQLAALGQRPEPLLESLDETINLAAMQKQLELINTRIERLGAINLAAIDEHAKLTEREAYLDQQHHDLTEAMGILEGAIGKIDKSTRSMFRDTFEAVNRSFSELFPSIFGGGKACLELTESDFLTTGVQVIAQPPGKRNSTIHMLSGGEKALTAIALVFSMFKLNPAPFCILDEVDAPLDDVNVGRYCNLLRAMAGNIQFLVISHNKVTISMADRLLGVTMQEAGVSRLVSVDMQAAIEMAE